jgi:hypothetical protein
MANVSENDAAKAIDAARALDSALLPVLGTYDDGTLLADSVQAWKAAGVPGVLRSTRAQIDRALANLDAR